MIGAVLNAGHRRSAFLVWIVSNTLCASYFLGATLGLWIAEGFGNTSLLAMYLIFLVTATAGWMNGKHPKTPV